MASRSSDSSLLGDGKQYLTPMEALASFSGILTQYEKEEINEFPNVYYVGREAAKKERFFGGRGGFNNEDGRYRLLAHDHIAYRYELLEMIGQGSFGDVVRAFDHKLLRHVAIKIIRSGDVFVLPSLREVAMLVQLKGVSTPSELRVAEILKSFVFRAHVVMVMELFESGDLYRLLCQTTNKQLSMTLVRTYTRDIVAAVNSIHSHGIVHGDIKPENIMRGQKWGLPLKLLDFGLARFFSEIELGEKTRYYRAPEVVLGAPYTCAIDMWSVGCLVAELVIGHPLFECNNEAELIAQHIQTLGIPPNTLVKPARHAWKYFDQDGQLRAHLNSQRFKPMSLPIEDVFRLSSPSAPPELVDFVQKCLTFDADARMTADEALRHPFLAPRRPTHPMLLRRGMSGLLAVRNHMSTDEYLTSESPLVDKQKSQASFASQFLLQVATGTHPHWGIGRAMSEREHARRHAASREGLKRGSIGTKSLPPSRHKPASSATIFREHQFQTTL